MPVDEQLKTQEALARWIDDHFRIELPHDPRSRLAIGCFDIAIEHHAAILLLAQSQLFGSMFALLRPIYEAFVRGAWLRYAASDAQLRQFEKGDVKCTFGEMISQVELAIDAPGSSLSRLKASSWDLMNDLTHTGTHQANARHGPATVGGNYLDESIEKGLSTAGGFALLSATELATYSGNAALVQLVREKAIQYSA